MKANDQVLNVALRATGTEQVERGLNRVGQAGAQMQQRVGMGARQVASGLEQMARSGKVAGDGLKQIISSGSEMAFLFGPAGAIAGALGITALAIYGTFRRTKEEIEATRKQAVEALRTIRQESLSANVERALVLFNGDEWASGLDTLSIAMLRNERAALSRQAALAKVGLAESLSEAQQQRLKDVTAELTERQREHARVMAEVARKTADAVLQQQVLFGIERDRTKVGPAPQPNIPGLEDAIFARVSQIPAITVPIKLVPKIEIEQTAWQKAVIDAERQIAANFENFGAGIAETAFMALGTALGGGDGKKVLLEGLGAIFTQMGQSLIKYGVLMAGLRLALKNPFTSGPAAIAAGVALVALGTALAGAAGGRGGGGGVGSYGNASQQTEQTTRIIVDPTRAGGASQLTPRETVVVQYMGRSADPAFENWLADRVRGAVRRGARIDAGKGLGR